VPIAGLHHAARTGAAGFCVFNDCGVAVEMLRRNHGLKRIAYVDIDAHHGDGVFYGFESDPDLIFADIHEDGRYLYPAPGPRTRSVAAPPRAQAQHPRATWCRQHRLRCRVAAGAGAPAKIRTRVHPVAGRRRQRWKGTRSRTCVTAPRSTSGRRATFPALADEFGHGRVLGTGGGGYNRINLAQAWSGVVQGLI
jgi:acetoin utilization protein AcuC